MKTQLAILGLLFVILIACNESASDEVKSFIPGTYSRHYTDEFTDSYDTVEIKLVTSGGSEGFEISKRMRFQKTIDGQQTPVDYKTETWFGNYDKDAKTVYIPKSGKTIYFDPEKNELKMGTEPYKKIK
jgi:hypothetical protein